MMTIEKIMSSAPVVVDPKVPLREVYRVMAEHRIRHIPVVSTDGLVGVISDRDVREALPSPMRPGEAMEFAAAMDRIPVWEVMAEADIDLETPQGVEDAFRRRPLSDWLADLRAADIAAEPAYPMGEVARDTLDWSDLEVDAAQIRTLWQIALAAELSGVLTGLGFGHDPGQFAHLGHVLAVEAQHHITHLDTGGGGGAVGHHPGHQRAMGAIQASFAGSITSMLQLSYTVLRRLPTGDRPIVTRHLAAHMVEILSGAVRRAEQNSRDLECQIPK